LRWDWGPIVFLGVVLPWALAITVETDGGFWGMSVGGDLAPKLFGGQEGHGAPPGYFLLLSPVLLFPAVLLLPAAAVTGWRGRAEPAIRFALAWLIPSWLVFELVPTKLPHYTLPCFGAIAWLMAAALTRPMGALSRRVGAILNLAVGAGFAAAGALAATFFGGPARWPRRSTGSGSPSASPRTWRGPTPAGSRRAPRRSPAMPSRASSSRSARRPSSARPRTRRTPSTRAAPPSS